MKKSGFTLTELIGVITILAVIGILVVPQILNQVRKKEADIDLATKEVIYAATKLYLDYHATDYPKTNGSNYCVPLQNLVNEDLLESPLQTARGETISLSTKVSVAVNVYGEFAMTYPGC